MSSAVVAEVLAKPHNKFAIGCRTSLGGFLDYGDRSSLQPKKVALLAEGSSSIS